MTKIKILKKTTLQTPKAIVTTVNIAPGPDLDTSGAGGFVADMLVVAAVAGAIVVATVAVAGAVVVEVLAAIAVVDVALFDTTFVDTTFVVATVVVFSIDSVAAAPETANGV